MKVLKQCKRCGEIYTDFCEKCAREPNDYLIKYGTELCSIYNVKIDSFIYFVTKYYGNFKDFKKIDTRRTRGSYFKMVASTFYIYANTRCGKSVRLRHLNGMLQQKKFYSGDLHKYIGFAFEELQGKNYRFKLDGVTRISNLHKAVKSVLGQLRKPSYFNHIVELIDLIKFDKQSIDPKTIASVYIAFYYRFMRGFVFSADNFEKKTGLSANTINNMYYSEFRYLAMQSYNGDVERVLETTTFI